jgi:CubicO group peptidase (beta-lactamase class C family)
VNTWNDDRLTPADEVPATLARAVASGLRATRFHFATVGDAVVVDLGLVPRHGAGEQRAVVGVALSHLKRVIDVERRAGFEPTDVALYGPPPRPLAGCLLASTGDASRVLAGPWWLENSSARLDEEHYTLETVSAWAGDVRVACVGVARRGSPFVPWSLHLWSGPAGGWATDPEILALARAARPVVQHHLGETKVLSLWHDGCAGPWPAEHPYAPRTHLAWDPPEGRTFEVVEGDSSVSSSAVDRIVREILLETGARHAHVAVVGRDRVLVDRCYGWREPSFPRPNLRAPARLGSLSKCLTALVVNRALARSQRTLDARIRELPGLEERSGPLGQRTVRELLEHRAGFPSRPELRHDDVEDALSEVRLGTREGGSRANPTDLLHAVDERGVLRPPSPSPSYSNESYIVLGEIARTMAGVSSYASLLSVEFDLGPDVLFATGFTASSARGEVPPQPSQPMAVAARFDEGDPFTLRPYVDDSAYLGAAAGVSVSALDLARVVGAHARPDEATLAGRRGLGELDPTTGLYVGDFLWVHTKFKTRTSRAERAVRSFITGRVHGGSALLVQEVPLAYELEPLTLVLTVNTLASLNYSRHGRALLGALERWSPP